MKEYKPDSYTLYLKDLYNKDEVFRYYCDYYKTCRLERFMNLSDVVDFANGGEYKKHWGAYRRRCEGWVKSANDIRSYMTVLPIDVESAFSLWYYYGWVNYETHKSTIWQMKYVLKKLNTYECIKINSKSLIEAYLLEYPNATGVEISKNTGLSTSTVYKWFKRIKEELSCTSKED